MRGTLAAVILAALTGCGGSESPTSPPSAPSKPTAPVDITTQLVGNPGPGAQCGLIVHAAPRIDLDFELEVVLPEGVTLTGGQTTWSGQGRANSSQELKLDFVTDGKRRELLVRATALSGTARQTVVKSIVLNEDGSKPASKGVTKVNSRGEKILEFPEK